MLRLPSLNEIAALFYQPTKVVHAIKDIELAAKRADSVVQFNEAKRAIADDDRQAAERRAEEAVCRAAEHQGEASRAARVSTRLRELVA